MRNAAYGEGWPLMAAPMEKTKTPGIYRRGSRYVVVYRAGGRQRKESARTLDEPAGSSPAGRPTPTAGSSRSSRGSPSASTPRSGSRATPGAGAAASANPRARTTAATSAGGSSRTASRATSARAGFFPDRLRLSELTPRHVAQFVAWLSEQTGAPGAAHGRRRPQDRQPRARRPRHGRRGRADPLEPSSASAYRTASGSRTRTAGTCGRSPASSSPRSWPWSTRATEPCSRSSRRPAYGCPSCSPSSGVT